MSDSIQFEKQKEIETIEDETLLNTTRSCIFETRVEQAHVCKTHGSKAYRDGEIDRAIPLYLKALDHVDFDEATWAFELLEEHHNTVNTVRLPVYLNLSACYLVEESWKKAGEEADKALAIEKNNIKALYRYGIANLRLKNMPKAGRALDLAAKKAPDDIAIRRAVQEWKQESKLAVRQEKRMWKKAFALSTSSEIKEDVLSTSSMWLYSSMVALLAGVCSLYYLQER